MDRVMPVWHKSSYSGANGGACVEVADNMPDLVLVRDTKDRDGGTLRFTPRAWREFIGFVKETATR